MSGKLKAIGAVLTVLLLIAGFLYVFWYLPYQYERTKNYKLGYEPRVIETMCNHLKPEMFVNYEKSCK